MTSNNYIQNLENSGLNDSAGFMSRIFGKIIQFSHIFPSIIGVGIFLNWIVGKK